MPETTHFEICNAGVSSVSERPVLLRQDKLALLGPPQSIDLTIVFDPDLLAATGERIETDYFRQIGHRHFVGWRKFVGSFFTHVASSSSKIIARQRDRLL